jgi:D-glycero-D-manno-heptose 1,7-bisphosphate phosphatase
MRPIIMFDVDGTLVRMVDETRGPRMLSEVEILPGIIGDCAALKSLGYTLCMVSNQPDVARGLAAREDVEIAHDFVRMRIGAYFAWLCYHDANDKCSCRKPKPGLLFAALFELDGIPARSIMAGDSDCDRQAAEAAGVKFFEVKTNEGISRLLEWISQS